MVPQHPSRRLIPARSAVDRTGSRDGYQHLCHGRRGGLFGEGVLRFDEIDTELSHSLRRELTIRDNDPLSAKYVLTQTYEMGRDGWRIRIESRTEMRSDKDNFYLTGNCRHSKMALPLKRKRGTSASLAT